MPSSGHVNLTVVLVVVAGLRLRRGHISIWGMRRSVRVLGFAVGLSLTLVRVTAARVTVPTGGAVWLDTAGKQINAHGGCVLQAGRTFYWYGENRTVERDSIGVNCYSSTNLAEWTFRNQVLSQSTTGLSESRFERPRVIYNEATRKYVLWAHRENLSNYADAQAVVAQSGTPDGHFKVVKIFRPFEKTDVRDHGKPGFMSRDCALFVDEDKTAWFISAANENADLMFYRLSPDYLDAVEHFNVLPEARREAPALFSKNGKYYLITSASTGWNPNYDTLQVADRITGPYGPQIGLISRYGDSTFNSQSTYVLPVAGSKGTTFIFMADRWKVWNLPNSRYLWQPLRFDNGVFQPMNWGDHWQVDAATGLAAIPLDPLPGDDDIALHCAVTCDKNNEPGGKEPRRVTDGSTKTGWAAETGEAPQWLEIDLGETCAIERSRILWEGDRRAYQYYIESSVDGELWMKVADQQHNEIISGTNTDELNGPGRYFRLTMTGKGAGTYFWATCMEWELLNGTNNLALNKPVRASSAEWGRYAAKITDGDFGTYWATSDAKPGHWAKIDLGKKCDLSACRVDWQNPGYYYQYKIEVSEDDATWSLAVDMSTNTVVSRTPAHAIKASARYLRLTTTGADDGCWPAVAEIEVYGHAAPGERDTGWRSSFERVTGAQGTEADFWYGITDE